LDHVVNNRGVGSPERVALEVGHLEDQRARWSVRGRFGRWPLEDTDGGRVLGLPQVEPQEVTLAGHWFLPNRGDTLAENAAWMSSSAKTASITSSKEQPYSWRYHRSPSTRFSSARNSGLMRGHCSAVTRTRSHASADSQAS